MTLALYVNAQGDQIVLSKTELGIVKENVTVGSHTVYSGEDIEKAKSILARDLPISIEYISWE